MKTIILIKIFSIIKLTLSLIEWISGEKEIIKSKVK